MSSSTVEVVVGCENQSHSSEESTKVGLKRKRTSSPEAQGEKKRSALPNGTVDTATQLLGQAEEQERERVAILDAGAQYGKVIDRRVRELSVETIILPLDTPAHQLAAEGYKALIISGSPGSVNERASSGSHECDPAIFSLNVPILGICYGLQLIVNHFGGTVERKPIREDGQFQVRLDPSCPLFAGLEEEQEVLLTHGDSVGEAPPTCRVVGRSGDIVAAVEHREKRIFGVQFHPEVDLTTNGKAIFRNFLFQISGCKGCYSLANRQQVCIDYIQRRVGEAKVLSLVSGGVDSAVCTALLLAALGPERVIAVHIDNGFMRKNESEEVKESLENLGLHPHIVNASHRFYTAQTLLTYQTTEGVAQKVSLPLHSVTSPEEKRAIIGNTFMRVADQVMTDLQLEADSVFLAQGTLRPDLIESASSLASARAHVIKTHHNDTELVRELRKKGRVIEPLSEFHKDEVRVLGEELGLPHSLVYRHPFPGPGLAIRIICQREAYIREDFSSTNSLLSHLMALGCSSEAPPTVIGRLLDQVTTPEERAVLASVTSGTELHATLLPIYSVGVQGDCRSYNYVVALSSNELDVNWDELVFLAKLIPRICHNVNRVVWLFGQAVQGPVVEVTPTYLTPGVLSTLREVDSRAHLVLQKHSAVSCISQMPVVLIPIDFERCSDTSAQPSFQHSAVIRTFITSDFMTGIPATPGKHLPFPVVSDMIQAISSVPGISRVLYDLTPKPPGTTEWE